MGSQRTWIRRGGRVLSILLALNGFVAVTLFIALTVVVSLQVFTRFVLHVPFLWSEEVARFLFFWVVLLGSAMSVRNRRHFVIDVTGGKLFGGARTRLLFDLFPSLCILGFSVLLLVEGIGYTRIGLLRTATNSQINMALVYTAIPLFAVLSAIYALGNLVQEIQTFVQGTGGPPSAEGPQAGSDLMSEELSASERARLYGAE